MLEVREKQRNLKDRQTTRRKRSVGRRNQRGKKKSWEHESWEFTTVLKAEHWTSHNN